MFSQIYGLSKIFGNPQPFYKVIISLHKVSLSFDQLRIHEWHLLAYVQTILLQQTSISHLTTLANDAVR